MCSVDLLFSFEWIVLSCFFVCLVIFFVVANWTFESYVITTLEITFSLFSRVCSLFNFYRVCLCRDEHMVKVKVLQVLSETVFFPGHVEQLS